MGCGCTNYNVCQTMVIVLTCLLFINSGMAKSSGLIFHMPPEWDRHNGTFMVFPASAKIWEDEDNLELVREDIARIARAISKYENVTMLVNPGQLEIAEEMINKKKNIQLVQMPVDDLWARDTLPVFGYRGAKKELAGVDFNFNGWGNKQIHAKDSKVADILMKRLRIPEIRTFIVGEGGALETDGEGTLLVTESSLVNSIRNPNKTRDEIEKELKRVLGMKKVIWFKGVFGEDITDAHVDCLVRFVRPGVVVLNRPTEGLPPGDDVWSVSSEQAKEVLDRETDAKGRNFTVIEMHEPDDSKIKDKHGDAFLSSYVNFYIANGAVIVPKFGDTVADLKAQAILKANFPGRDIVPVRMPALAAGGGGIHCATHDVPCFSMSKGIRVQGSCDK